MGQMKVIAMYLPQYHRIPENDAWWGDGYTEWVAVKNATRLFEGHNQPRAPLNNNYYNLLEKGTLKWQVKLAKEYQIYGFCFYHYWFKGGRRVLEKPAENLLKWADIDMPFCFSWANETWARTWSGIPNNNSWAIKYESVAVKGREDSGILLEQSYGEERDWTAHYEYLLPFFKDKRYIKIGGRPVFIIYRPQLVHCLGAMVSCFKKLSHVHGIGEPYIIGTNCSGQYPDILDGVMLQEPTASENRGDVEIHSRPLDKGSANYVDYDELWDSILNYKPEGDEKTYLGAITDYDTTPRRAAGGKYFAGAGPHKFSEYFDRLVRKSLQMGNEYVFINAWNEWGEGMYLEPDTVNGYGYLEAVRKAVSRYEGIVIETVKPEKDKPPEIQDGGQNGTANKKLEKTRAYFNTLNGWLFLKERGVSLAQYLVRKEYLSIAVYGMGVIGRHLVEELRDSPVQIKYVIDRNAGAIHSEFQAFYAEEELPEADAVIVTPVAEFAEIKKKLEAVIDCPILSIDELILESNWEG